MLLKIIKNYWKDILFFPVSMKILLQLKRLWKGSYWNWTKECENSSPKNSRISRENFTEHSRNFSVVERALWNWQKMKIYWKLEFASSHSHQVRSFRI